MGYLDNKGLEHYSWLVRNKLAQNWQMTRTAPAVQFCPAPQTELEPIVDFIFTETPPAEGEKGPDNPSTIAGISSVSVSVGESEDDAGATEYTISLGDTYYGGSVNFKTGVMTVTRILCELDSTEWWSPGDFNATTGYGWSYCAPVNISGYAPISGVNSAQDPSIISCSHFPISTVGIGSGSIADGSVDFPAVFLTSGQCRFSFQQPSLQAWKDYLAAQKTAGTPVCFAYKIDSPFTVQLTPTQIFSLAQADKYVPQINTVYSDQQAVRVGWQRIDIDSILARLDAIEARLA